MRIADAVWVATAQLHRQNLYAQDFSVQEIMEQVTRERLVEGFPPGLQVHVSKHCVANKSPNPGRYRMLFETVRGRRRLFKRGDPFHPAREAGKIHPEKRDLPPGYQSLIDWYESTYSSASDRQSRGSAPRPDLTTMNNDANDAGSSVTAFVSSHGAFVIPEELRKQLGIRGCTKLSVRKDNDRLIIEPVTADFVDRVAGSYKGKSSMVEARERDHRIER